MPVPNPIAFSIFGIDIMWYGLLIALGMITGFLIVYKRTPLHDLEREKIIDYVIISVPAGIIGARLYYVIFNWESYRGDFLKICNIRLGGLAIHGGLIFAFLAILILSKYRKDGTLNVLDLAVPGIALAQAIGRWGNYFNSEAHGGPTDLPWGVNINGVNCHPTFLYESIWCFILCFVLIYIDNRRKFDGQTFLLYGMLYSLERFFVEALRTDSLMIGPLKQAQVLSASAFFVSLVLYIILYIKYLRNIKTYRDDQ